MAIAVLYSSNGLTPEQYDRIGERLDQGGSFPMPGLISHTAYSTPEGLRVFEVYESPEAFQAAGSILGPIMQEMQLPAGDPPPVFEVYASF
jgi:hypothetical protein